jgi:hypothetical protein
MVYGKSGLRMLAAKNSRKRMSAFSPYTATIAVHGDDRRRLKRRNGMDCRDWLKAS